MKKTSLVKRNALVTSAAFSRGVITLAIIMLFAAVRLVAPDLFYTIISPAVRVGDTLASSYHSAIGGFTDKSALVRANESLAAANAAQEAAIMTLTEKVAVLTGLIGSSAKRAPGIDAEVILRPPESPYDTLVVGAGEDDGVTEGMEAFGAGGVPLGIVTSTLARFSRVTLFSAPGVTTSGWVGSSTLPVMLQGAGAGVLRASVSRAATIVPGDPLYLPGPGALYAGRVVRVDSDPLSPSITLQIRSLANPFSLTAVELRSTGVGGVSFATSTP